MTKQEFIEKFHTSKTYKFEPPTWEDFLTTRDEDNVIFAHWFCGDICVVLSEENDTKGEGYYQFEVFLSGDNYTYKKFYCSVIESPDFIIDFREDIYYEALEYAQKLFLEE